MTTLSVYIATSVDGFIATDDDRLDWLEGAAGEGEDYGFDAFLATVDALAMGRGTWDHIAHLEVLPFGDRPVYVFTHRPPEPRAGVTFCDLSPRAALARFEAEGHRRVYVDGGAVISAFLAEGLIDELTLFTAPVLLGSGKPLFHGVASTAALVLESTESWPSGFLRRTYHRASGPERAAGEDGVEPEAELNDAGAR